jgi:alpha-tubulin suppressor-like RCC1 family protein
LGDGTSVDSNIPVQVGVTGITAIAAGSNSSYFLKSDSTVWACGFNSSGQLGLGNSANQNTPVQIPNLSKVIKISAGMLHALFLKEDGTVWAVGNNLVSQLGSSTFGMASSVVVQVPGISDVVDISAGFQHSLFLKNDGTVWAAGFGPFGQSTTLSALTQISSPCTTATEIHSNEILLEDIKVFPNPATGIITITNIPENSNVNVIDITGKTIKTVFLIDETTLNLDVLHLGNGVYFVQVNGKGFNTIRKIVVNN